ncbi:hypothetical protein IAT40_000897 [Kwoniella sp. CBS 6097]
MASPFAANHSILDVEEQEASTVEEEQEESINWHPFYNDPQDKVIILSNNKVRFRASLFRLISASSFFSGLLDTPRPKGGNVDDADEPIELDFPANIISHMLDLTSVHTSYIHNLEINTAKGLLEVGEFTLCEM